MKNDKNTNFKTILLKYEKVLLHFLIFKTLKKEKKERRWYNL